MQADTLNYNCSRTDWRIDTTNVTIDMGTDSIQAENARFLFRTDDKWMVVQPHIIAIAGEFWYFKGMFVMFWW